MTGSPLAPRPITDKDRQKILIPIKSGMQELIFGKPGLFIDRPGFVAGPQPETGLATIVQQLTRFNCRRWAASNKNNYSQAVNAGNAELCSLYLESLGEKPDDGGIAPPFTGGQCDKPYRVRFVGNTGPTGSPFDYFALCHGPIGGVRITATSGGTCIGEVLARACNISQPNCAAITPGAYTWRPCGISGQGLCNGALSIGEVIACTGEDDCGNVDSLIQPPATVTPSTPIPPQITINLPGFGEVKVTVALDEDGNPVVCIPEMDACFTINRDDEDEDPADEDEDDRTLDPGEADSEQEQTTESGGVAGGCAGEDEELVGVLVEVVEAPPSANQFNNNPGEIYRGIGYVRMGWQGRLGVDPTGAVVRSPQFFHAQQLGLQCWEVRANIGFRLKATPYYRATKKPE
jgi:hypothetical protein